MEIITCGDVSSSHGIGHQVSLVSVQSEELHSEGDLWSSVELVQPDLGGGEGLGEVEGLGHLASTGLHQVITVSQALQVANIERLGKTINISYSK